MADQKIFFGPPGTGKSFKIDGIVKDKECIRTVFYPDYSYGDFVGKLTPVILQGGHVAYEYQLGPFLLALASALKNVQDQIYLVIEELNRGNSSSIFGNVFQLLDRDSNGLSQYWVSIPKQAFLELMKKVGISLTDDHLKNIVEGKYDALIPRDKQIIEKIKNVVKFDTFSIKLPSNFNILCTMNSSDHSIFYMDSAFKRRWDWEFIDLKTGNETINKRMIKYTANKKSVSINWVTWVNQLNLWLSSQANMIKMIENKQLGYFFINKNEITEDDIKQKIMFFLWDSVFDRDKTPLVSFVNQGQNSDQIVNFGDFIKHSTVFIEKINQWQTQSKS